MSEFDDKIVKAKNADGDKISADQAGTAVALAESSNALSNEAFAGGAVSRVAESKPALPPVDSSSFILFGDGGPFAPENILKFIPGNSGPFNPGGGGPFQPGGGGPGNAGPFIPGGGLPGSDPFFPRGPIDQRPNTQPPQYFPPKGEPRKEHPNGELPSGYNDSTATKLAREAFVLGGGLGESVLYGMANLHRRLPEIGASMGIGAALSAVTKAGKGGAAAAMIFGAYMTSRFVVNAINDKERWSRFGEAVKDTWNTDENLWRNLHEVSATGGNFVFDTGLSMGAGYIGYTNKPLADLLFQLLRFPVPLPAPIPNTPGGPSSPRNPGGPFDPRNPFPAIGTLPLALEIVPQDFSFWPGEVVPPWKKQQDQEWRDRNKPKEIKAQVPGEVRKIEDVDKEASKMLGEKKDEGKKVDVKPVELDQTQERINRMLNPFTRPTGASKVSFSPESPISARFRSSDSLITNPEVKAMVYGR